MKGAQQPQSNAPQQKEAQIPFKEVATKEGLSGLFGISMTDSDRMALLAASGKLMSTPGRLGTGLGAAAQEYAKTKLEYAKNQRELAEGQSRAERDRASAYETTGRGIKERVQPAATGVMVYGQDANNNPIVGISPMPEVGGHPVTLNPQGGGDGKPFAPPAQTTGAPPAPTAPTGPNSKPSEISLQLGPVHDEPTNADQNNKEEILKQMGRKATESQFSPFAKGNAESYKAIRDEANQEAQAAQSTASSLAQGIRAFTDIPETGILAPGAAAPLRYAAVNYFNTLMNLSGNEAFSPETVTADQVQTKLNTLRAQNAQKGIGKEAGFFLNALAKAGPSTELNKETSADILANMYVGNRISRDRARVYNEYGEQKYSAGLGYNAQDAFDKINPSGAYNKDMNAIKDILLTTTQTMPDGKSQNWITLLIDHPEMAPKFDKLVREKYKIQNMSRYFIG